MEANASRQSLGLSVIVITKNEASRIGDCLASVQFADEIIVLDGCSTDATADIARAHGAAIRGAGVRRVVLVQGLVRAAVLDRPLLGAQQLLRRAQRALAVVLGLAILDGIAVPARGGWEGRMRLARIVSAHAFAALARCAHAPHPQRTYPSAA